MGSGSGGVVGFRISERVTPCAAQDLADDGLFGRFRPKREDAALQPAAHRVKHFLTTPPRVFNESRPAITVLVFQWGPGRLHHTTKEYPSSDSVSGFG